MKKEIVSKKRKEIKLTKSIKNLGVVNCLLLLNNSKLALTSDYSIIIYILPLFELTMILKHHKSAIYFISRLDENTIISCSNDRAIIIWRISGQKHFIELSEVHFSTITQVIPLSNGRFASCSLDKTINFYRSSLPYNQLSQNFRLKRPAESIIQIKEKEILVACSIQECIFFDLINYQIISLFDQISCCGTNGILQINKNTLIIGGLNTISILNINKFRFEKQIFGEDLGNVKSFLLVDNTNLIVGTENSGGSLLQIDLGNYEWKNIKRKAHNFAINSIIFANDSTIITCSNEELKVWDYK